MELNAAKNSWPPWLSKTLSSIKEVANKKDFSSIVSQPNIPNTTPTFISHINAVRRESVPIKKENVNTMDIRRDSAPVIKDSQSCSSLAAQKWSFLYLLTCSYYYLSTDMDLKELNLKLRSHHFYFLLEESWIWNIIKYILCYYWFKKLVDMIILNLWYYCLYYWLYQLISKYSFHQRYLLWTHAFANINKNYVLLYFMNDSLCNLSCNFRFLTDRRNLTFKLALWEIFFLYIRCKM